MTEPNSYIPQESPNLEFVYNNESELKSFYWPLFWSEYEIPQQANQLFNDYDSDYITYSGDSWKSLMVSKEKDGRYKNFTLRAYSGDSFNFYLSAGSLVDGVETYYSGPVTTSGNYSVLTPYSGQSTAEANAISFTAPGDNTTVYTFPEVSTINFVKLYHQASTVSGEYRLYQFLPRTLIQVDDLEADVISAVTVRVQDTIVIGPDMIGDKTLLGRKIVDGTLSGILLTDGTITGSKIQANTISGVLIAANTITSDKINVNQLDALAANMGTLTVNSGITLGADGFLWTGYSNSGEYTITKKGVKVVNSFTAGTVVFLPGGGEVITLGNLDEAARAVVYRPTYFSTPSGTPQDPVYTLSTYSGDLNYFEITANQFGRIGYSQQSYNGYNSDIRLGFAPSVGDDLNSNYSSFKIGSVASGYSLLRLYSYGDYTGMVAKSSVLNLENGKALLTSTDRVQVTSPIIRLVESLKVSKDISQTFPNIELYSDILSVDSQNFVYAKPSTGIGFPAVERMRITAEGQVSISGSLTVSGNIVGRGTSISYLDDSDGSTIFSASSTGIVLNSAAGNRIIDISTSTGNFDLLGGDFFIYNSAESAIVAGIDKTGILQVSDGSITTPALSFRNDTDTGFYKVEPDAVRLACGGVWSAYFDATRTMIPDGTVNTPGLSFINDQDTGFYRAEANAIRISTGNNFTGLFSTNQLQMASGTEALPSYTFVNDNDTGMYRSAANAVALTAGGNQILTAASAGQVLISTANSNGQLTIEVPNGTARTVTTWRQLNDASAYINFVSNTVTASTPIQTSALGAYAGKVRVQVNGVVRWIPFYQ